MAKLVDAPASGAGDRKVVEVRVLFWAPSGFIMHCWHDCSFVMIAIPIYESSTNH